MADPKTTIVNVPQDGGWLTLLLAFAAGAAFGPWLLRQAKRAVK